MNERVNEHEWMNESAVTHVGAACVVEAMMVFDQ